MEKEVYNWQTNVIEFKDKYKNHYYLQLRGSKNVVKGNSGTGKSYLCHKIDKMKQRMDSISVYNTDNIFVVNKNNLEGLKEIKNKLVLIDNADLILDEAAIDFINMDDDNRYLIFARVPIGINMSPNHQADLVQEGDMTILRYRFNVKGWC